MAYSTSNPPTLLVPSIGAKPAVWAYRSTNTSTETLAAGFFSNGAALGLKAGDIVVSINSTSGVPYITGVSSVTASSAATVVASTAT
jgi:hypothetical protein